MKPDWMTEVTWRAGEAAPQRPVLPARTPGRVLHIDGDYLAYFAAGGEDCEPGRARLNVIDRVETAMMMCGAAKCVMHLTMSGSHKGHRYLVATVKPYQGQRGGSQKPKNWEYLREFLENYEGHLFTVKRWLEREADDGLALAAHNTRDPVLHTRDKDMRMLPGIHLNWMTYQMIQVGKDPGLPVAWNVMGQDGLQYGLKWFMLQMLQGDGADNIPGLPRPRLGPKTAEKMLGATDYGAAAAIVQASYQQFYDKQWADRLAEQSCLLWLRTDPAASLRDWLKAWPDDETLHRAADRLEARVHDQLNYLESIGCSD